MDTGIILSRLCSQLGLESTDDPERDAQQIVNLFYENKDVLEERAVKGAIARGVLEQRESKWAYGFIAEHNLATFSAFCTARKKQGFSAHSQSTEPDDTQKKINKQFGLSDEVFKKYEAER